MKERLQTDLIDKIWKSKRPGPGSTRRADVFAAQDQAIRTNWLKAAIEKEKEVTEKCRICNQHNESVEHILNGCTKLANGDYKLRHDRVAAALHWGMCKDHGFPAESKWWSHYAEKVLENEKGKILWDFHIQTDNPIEACKPDLVLLDKSKKEAILIVNDKKIEKYQELRRELTRIWALKKATVIPIMIGALGGIIHNSRPRGKLLNRRQTHCGAVRLLSCNALVHYSPSVSEGFTGISARKGRSYVL
eukprot:sb/3468812/